MAGKPPSIGDIISQFAMPPEKPSSPADEWLSELSNWLTTCDSVIHRPREPGLHASGLASVCARREIIEETFGKKAKKSSAGKQLTYDIGHAMHFWWQHRYLGPKQELWGEWMCLACRCQTCGDSDLSSRPDSDCKSCKGYGRKITTGFMPLKCECGVDWRDAVRYLEPHVVNKELGYVGHTDGILVHKKNKRRIFEFKTDGPSTYDERTEPNPEHVIQAHAYMGPLGLTETLIVYQAKAKQCDWSKENGEWLAGPPCVKPYLIHYDPIIWGPIEQRIKKHHEARALIQKLLDEKRHPTRDDIAKFDRVCDSPKCKLARDCSVAKQCFSIL